MWENGKKPVKEAVEMTKQNILLLIFTMGLGIIGDLLFFKKPFGISVPIFVLLFYVVFIWRTKDQIKFKIDIGWLLSIPVFGLSLTYVLFSNGVFRVLNVLAIPILVIAQTLILCKANNSKWFELSFFSDILEGIFVKSFMYFGVPFRYFEGLIKIKEDKNKTLFKIIAGILISIPLILVILPLLSSADIVFGHYLNSLPNIFTNFNLGDLIFQAVLFGLIFLTTFSYIWSMIKNKKSICKQNTMANKENSSVRFMDPIIVSTVLISVNVIYILFVVVQFTYLLGGVKPLDYSFAEYARRGFFELVAVSIINFSILLFNMNFTKEINGKSSMFLKIANTSLIICTLVILYSAHYRMMLYENEYGFTYLRVFTHSFMVFIFVLLAVSAAKVWNKKMVLTKYYFIISIIAYLIINYMNVDAIIASKNIERYTQHKKPLDVAYFNELSYDAVPYLEKYIDDKVYGINVRQCLERKSKLLDKSDYWQSFNVSEYKARKILLKNDIS